MKIKETTNKKESIEIGDVFTYASAEEGLINSGTFMRIYDSQGMRALCKDRTEANDKCIFAVNLESGYIFQFCEAAQLDCNKQPNAVLELNS